MKQTKVNKPEHVFSLFCVLCYGRYAVDMEVSRYVGEAYPKGVCSVYCVNGKDAEGPESDFELAVVIAAARHSPQNFWCVHNLIIIIFLSN